MKIGSGRARRVTKERGALGDERQANGGVGTNGIGLSGNRGRRYEEKIEEMRRAQRETRSRCS